MKCTKCGEREANFFYSEMINGKKTEYILCSECAKDMGLLQKEDEIFDRVGAGFDSVFDSFFNDTNRLFGAMPRLSGFGIGGFFPSFFIGGAAEEKEAKSNDGVCPKCGAKYTDRAGNGTAGCSECYGRDADNASEKTEKKLDPEKEIKRLEKALKAAVAAENYERAAVLRDEIKKLRQ